MSTDETIAALLAQNAELMRMMSAMTRPAEPAAPKGTITIEALSKAYYEGEGHTLDSAKEVRARRAVIINTKISHQGEMIAFGKLAADDVDKIVLASFRAARKKAKTRLGTAPRPATRNREVALIRRWRCWGHAEGYPCKPLANVFMEKEENVKKGKIATDEVLARLLNACDTVGTPGVMRAMVLTLIDTGMRISEVRDLRWDGFDHRTGRVALLGEDTKNDTPRVPRLTADALEAVLALPRRCEYVFASDKHNDRYSERHVGQMFDDAIAAAKIYGPRKGDKFEKITLHALRHSFIYRARTQWKLPRAVIKKMTGHKTDAAFDRYGIVDEEEVDAAFDQRDEELAKTRMGPHSMQSTPLVVVPKLTAK